MTTNLADQRFMVPFLPPRHLARPRLDRIVRRWPHRVRLVVAARSGPLLPLHRYRLSGQMAELRATDLAMTPPEARQLLEEHGVRLPDEELQVLTARTEGWTAGLDSLLWTVPDP
jgi:LuxR family transcriptional regulator, maltose regulon positive regulatory protein